MSAKFGIYTIVNGVQFYYDSHNNQFTKETKLYSNSGIDCMMYAFLMASDKVSTMRDALKDIDMVIDFDLFFAVA